MYTTLRRLTALLLLAPVPLAAQRTLDSVAQNLKPGQYLRVRTLGGLQAEGQFAGYTPDPPTVRLTVGDSSISVTTIHYIWVRGHAAGSGAILGAIAGGVGMALASAALCEGAFHGECRGGRVLSLVAAGAAGGALLGVTSGALATRWRLRYAQVNVGVTLLPLSGQRVGTGVAIQLSTHPER